MRARNALMLAVGAAGLAAVAMANPDECALDADGRILYNGDTLSETAILGEGEIGDTVGVFEAGSTSGNPILTCELVE